MRFGLILAAIAAALDQLSKWIMVEQVFRPEGVTESPFFTMRIIEVLPFFNLRMAWNPGISFSMFSSGEPTTVALLITMQVSIVCLMLWWLRKADTRLMIIGLGLIIGGALGNIIDRINYGMVADFLDFHAAGYHFPTFNLADTFISVGVGFWLLDAFLTRDQDKTTNSPPANPT